MEFESPWKFGRDDTSLARQWQRRARGPLPFILGEVQSRMISRATIIRPPEGQVVIHGWLHQEAVVPVLDLFPKREFKIIAHTQVYPQLAGQSAARQFMGALKGLIPASLTSSGPKTQTLVSSPGQPLPLEEASCAMVWSPLWLQSIEDPAFLLQEWFRVLALEGGVFFSALGPDTASLIKSIACELGLPFPDFMDMHDLGDLMSRCGFSDPVMEMEKIKLSYADVAKLLDEWRALFGNNLQGRTRGLRARSIKHALLERLENFRSGPDGRVLLELELVYGHAWKIRPKTNPGEVVVPVSSIKRTPKN